MPPDYSGQNLRGRSFKGQDLSRTNFSKADIRGANFSKAILKGTNFTGAKAGLQKRWTVGLLIASWLLSAISGFFSIFLGLLVAVLFRPTSFEDLSHDQQIIIGIVVLILLLVFCIITLRKGLTAGLGAGAIAGAGVAAAVGVVVFAGAGSVVAAIALGVAFAVAGAIAFAVAIAVAFAGTFGFAGAGAGVVAVAVAVAFTLFSAYIGWRSLAGNEGNEKDAWVRSFAITFAATGGTSFFSANLIDADFTRISHKKTKKGVENCENVYRISISAAIEHDPIIHRSYTKTVQILS